MGCHPPYPKSSPGIARVDHLSRAGFGPGDGCHRGKGIPVRLLSDGSYTAQQLRQATWQPVLPDQDGSGHTGAKGLAQQAAGDVRVNWLRRRPSNAGHQGQGRVDSQQPIARRIAARHGRPDVPGLPHPDTSPVRHNRRSAPRPTGWPDREEFRQFHLRIAP